ncbi:MAG TPA: M24 family metallopeptidase [Dehalococcoidales bacterium]|nr:M24 family metallopeptidase [Dehalococcoidales bacterium]
MLSFKEKERRYSLLRRKLKSAGLSALIVYGGTQLGVPVQYLTQVWGNKSNMVIFPVEGEPVFLTASNSMTTPLSISQQGCWIQLENIRSSANQVEDLGKQIREWKLDHSRIGIDSYRFWPVFEYQHLMELCPGIQLVESHRLFGEIRGSKSEEELAEISKAIKISDLAHYAFLANLESGLTEAEVAGKANAILESKGVGDRIILIHSRPESPYPNRPGPAVISRPDPVTFSPEFSRNAGYGAQMIRAYWWEEPQGIYKRMFDLWKEMRRMVPGVFRPGVEITDAGKAIVKLIEDYGFECDKLGHAVGVAYGDVPYITAGPDEKDYMEWTILPNEIYAVHPMVRCKGYKSPFSMIGDMYLTGKDETIWMTRSLPGLPEFIP